MTSDPVIKHFDVVEHIRLSQVTGFVDPLPDTLLFQLINRLDDNIKYLISATSEPVAEQGGLAELAYHAKY